MSDNQGTDETDSTDEDDPYDDDDLGGPLGTTPVSTERPPTSPAAPPPLPPKRVPFIGG
jgi:hypothetical protein